MENLSKFEGAVNFAAKVVKSGSKVTASAYPEISLDTTYNKFTANSKARRLMEVTEGDYIVFIDMGADADDREERFLVTKGYDLGNDNMEGAKIGDHGSFNYSVIYGAMLNHALDGTDDAAEDALETSELKPKDLVQRGLLEPREHKNTTSYVSLKKISCRLTPINEGNPVTINSELGIEQPVFLLTNWYVKDHNPKESGSEEGEGELEEVVEAEGQDNIID